MQRARARQRLTSWLALFALALQLVVSFAHVHREDFAGIVVPGITQVAPAHPTPNGVPDDDHLTCDICASVHLAGTLVVPLPPPLALPAMSVGALLLPAPPAAPRPGQATAFDARGPPQS